MLQFSRPSILLGSCFSPDVRILLLFRRCQTPLLSLFEHVVGMLASQEAHSGCFASLCIESSAGGYRLAAGGGCMYVCIVWSCFFFLFFFFHLTYSRWTSSLSSCLWSQRIFPSLPGSRLTFFLSRCKFSTLTTRQPMVEFYLLTFPRFPLRKKEHKSYLG